MSETEMNARTAWRFFRQAKMYGRLARSERDASKRASYRRHGARELSHAQWWWGKVVAAMQIARVRA